MLDSADGIHIAGGACDIEKRMKSAALVTSEKVVDVIALARCLLHDRTLSKGQLR